MSIVKVLLEEWKRVHDPYLLNMSGFEEFLEERLYSPIQPGDIVFQTWAWIGVYQAIIPYWQVRFVKDAELYHGIMSEREAKRKFDKQYRREGQGVYTPNPEGGYDYYCHAVPYTAWPMQIQWFHISQDDPKLDIAKTGLRWRVPTWGEHGSWYEAPKEEIQLPEHWSGHRNLNESDICVSLRRPKDDGRPCCPLIPEKELVNLLNLLPVKYWEWTRENFEEKMRILLEWM